MQKQALSPGKKAALTRKKNLLKAGKIKPSAKQQVKKRKKQRLKKLVPFGGKVVDINSLVTVLHQYATRHRTEGIAPTEVVKMSWEVIRNKEAEASASAKKPATRKVKPAKVKPKNRKK